MPKSEVERLRGEILDALEKGHKASVFQQMGAGNFLAEEEADEMWAVWAKHSNVVDALLAARDQEWLEHAFNVGDADFGKDAVLVEPLGYTVEWRHDGPQMKRAKV